ncbi:apolipoprotein N-acyltransferase [Deinococcus sp. ZS9-10]|uniref:Apolipoprotein N-acyltransferase n=1 Tax=Deinococcus arenicola TaxID=2994950 RepID=A0ABU4DQ56_9DEIO|nr:apolipoprotein N-acyltransferase [Deinococcus sp. ZS9-10]MDV6374030.1 apolipoprotein N-acyltransferase [Deinococcus sp. ZS9-10]
MPAVPPPLFALLLGVFLGFCGLPLPWSFLSFIPLAGILLYVASARTVEGVSGRILWAGAGYFAVHLWWLTAFLGKIFGFPPAGVLALVLFLLEGLFLALMAYPLARLIPSTAGRIWALAGGWVVLEWLRFLGPLAFPWPTLGYTLLPTGAVQIADLGGVLLGSVLVAGTAAALAGVVLGLLNGGRGSGRPVLLAALCWTAALAYGSTRTAGEGPVQPMLVLRTDFDSFGRAVGSLTPGQQLQDQRDASAGRKPDEVLVWSETALTAPAAQTIVSQFPGPGISGLGAYPSLNQKEQNAVVSIGTLGEFTGINRKAKLVPFGEYFVLYDSVLRPVYSMIENIIGFKLPAVEPARSIRPLTLNGVQYGAYICYDSVFPWVARSLTRQGAQLLVNPSNDGWYDGWGVQQHFMMGRVRAIENRRWLIRSVNRGVAGSVNDLGQPVNIISSGDQTQALSVRPRLLTGRTLFNRLGDWPALLLALGMIGYGVRLEVRGWED